jgi:hypothetical protein
MDANSLDLRYDAGHGGKPDTFYGLSLGTLWTKFVLKFWRDWDW